MLYGRLENNTIAEVINVDPAGRYHPDIVWVQIPVEYGLLTTKEKNNLLVELKEASDTKLDERAAGNIEKEAELKKLWKDIQLQFEILEANGVDSMAVWQASVAPPEEEAEEEEAAAE